MTSPLPLLQRLAALSLAALSAIATSSPCCAQTEAPADAASTPAPGVSQSTSATPPGSPGSLEPGFLGREVPLIDPATETVTWDGKTWSITNNRLFRARFEKYLGAKEADPDEDAGYRAALDEVLEALSPKREGGPSLPRAIASLTKASQYPIDARISDSLVNTVYGVWLARNSARAMAEANKELDRERKQLAHNMEVASDGNGLGERRSQSKLPGTAGGEASDARDEAREARSDGADMTVGRVGLYIKRTAEIEAMSAVNKTKAGISEIKSKLEFQGLILQLLVQRRFEHVVIGTRLYRRLFSDGDGDLEIKEGSQVDHVFARGIGVNPTLSSVDAIASEAIREVAEGIEAFQFYADRGDLESASKRLSEAFMVGEYLPGVRTLPRTEKMRVLEFVRDSNQLVSALEVHNFGLVEELVDKLQKSAPDFDSSKARAAVESARTVAGMHLQKARNAAIAQQLEVVAVELEKAATIWPNNPELKSVSDLIFERGDAHTRVLDDLNSLIAQKNYRQIFLDQAKYLAASIGKKEYEDKLKEVIEDMTLVQMGLQQAKGLSAKGDKHGAWEIVEEMREKFPTDAEISVMSAQLTGEVAQFVSWLKNAKRLEEARKLGPALAYYLKAKEVYPVSSYVEEGVDRIVADLFPDAADDEDETFTSSSETTSADEPQSEEQ
ncbi:MAG: hypothetical protein O3C21_17935 [Verrucomicrobia bacterium]|nr:hypothetical protein [Verrucomicrobiota bacterium]